MALDTSRYDVVINGQNYKFFYSEPLSPGGERAQLSASRTFLGQDTSAYYGANDTNSYLAANQRDFSLGEGQRYFEQTDPDSSRRYRRAANSGAGWTHGTDTTGEGLYIDIPGEITIGWASGNLAPTSAGKAWAICSGRGSLTTALDYSNEVIVVSDNKIMIVHPDGLTSYTGPAFDTSGDGSIRPHALCDDGNYIYCAGQKPSGGNIFVKKFDKNAHTWSDFADMGNAVDHILGLEFHNSAIWAITEHMHLYSFSTAGALIDKEQWTGGEGSDINTHYFSQCMSYSGELWILMDTSNAEIWRWDGQGASIVARFPNSFTARDMCAFGNIIFISGVEQVHTSAGASSYRPCVYYYNAGTIGKVWTYDASPVSATTSRGSFISPWSEGVVWLDTIDGYYTYYNVATGGFNRIALATTGTIGDVALLRSSQIGIASCDRTADLSSGTLHGIDTYPLSYATTASLQTSMFDFGTGKNKDFKSVTIDCDLPTGTSIELGYRLNSPDGSVTVLSHSITSGAENWIGQMATSIGFELRLFGTTTARPTVKRITVNATPAYKRRNIYLIDCSDNMKLRDGSSDSRNGITKIQDLTTAAKAAPITIEDRLGSYSGVIEFDQTSFSERRAGQYIATVVAREI